MHEMGVALQIVDIATASIPAEMKEARVARINLKIGKLSAVVTDSLRFCFEIVTQDTPLYGAELAIQEIPIRARCHDCHTEWTIETPVFACRNCNSGAVELLSGRELDIDSIEIEDQTER